MCKLPNSTAKLKKFNKKLLSNTALVLLVLRCHVNSILDEYKSNEYLDINIIWFDFYVKLYWQWMNLMAKMQCLYTILDVQLQYILKMKINNSN